MLFVTVDCWGTLLAESSELDACINERIVEWLNRDIDHGIPESGLYQMLSSEH